jgi:hypothetical protein
MNIFFRSDDLYLKAARDDAAYTALLKKLRKQRRDCWIAFALSALALSSGAIYLLFKIREILISKDTASWVQLLGGSPSYFLVATLLPVLLFGIILDFCIILYLDSGIKTLLVFQGVKLKKEAEQGAAANP